MSHDFFVMPLDSPGGKDLDSVIGTKPTRYSVAISSPVGEECFQAMRQEVDGLIVKDTFTLANLPPRGKTICGCCVHEWKVNDHNEIVRAGSRLIMRDFMQDGRWGGGRLL